MDGAAVPVFINDIFTALDFEYSSNRVEYKTTDVLPESPA
jgi:hypothetical protein